MKHNYLLLLAILFFCTGPMQAQTLRPLKKTQELMMPKTADDENCGTRGASVMWHPDQKKYYAVFAGNARYPSAVFNEDGKRLSDKYQLAMVDARGLWYNPATKSIFGNAYNDAGWYEYKLDKQGMMADVDIAYEGMKQPNGQCVGVYNTKSNQVLFLHGSEVYAYNNKAEEQGKSAIHFGRTKAEGAASDEDLTVTPDDYNYTSMVYTGITGQELGFENLTKKQIELYDIKTGFLTKTLLLPELPETEGTFNFSYANGIFWLFDIEKRTWMGYK